ARPGTRRGTLITNPLDRQTRNTVRAARGHTVPTEATTPGSEGSRRGETDQLGNGDVSGDSRDSRDYADRHPWLPPFPCRRRTEAKSAPCCANMQIVPDACSGAR